MKIGVIGGSGLDDPNLISDYEEKEVSTPYGNPSSKLTCGKISGVDVCILSRHGKNHDIPPGRVNYRANVYALKEEGCEVILATSAVGSLREEVRPGNLVFPSQFIDFTKKREMTFYDKVGEVKHTPMEEPFDKSLRDILCNVCDEYGFEFNKDVTVVTIEGPRFSSKSESYMFKHWGADIINMSTCPEVILANELSIPYQTIAMSTDYDCWKEDEEPVTWEMILKRMHDNSEKVKKLLVGGIERIVNRDLDFIKSKIRTIPDFPKPGIQFRDITTLMKDKDGYKKVVDILYDRYKDKNIESVAGIESRGFIVGGVLADRLGVGFTLIRKPGKLPSETIKEEYSLEYGMDSVEIHTDAISRGERVLLIDDLIATGGTARAACNLIEKVGGEVVEAGFIVELPTLKGREKLGKFDVYSMVSFDGE
jgi:5'-methylthioadenosine phosphorylase